MEKDLISIIIPAYNAECEILRCLKSLLDQTYRNLEILVIDDGSTDTTYSIVKGVSLKDNRVKVFTQKNSGVSAARNLGIKKMHGKYVTFTDADDYVQKDYIEKMADYIDHYDLVICGYNMIREETIPVLLNSSCELTKEQFFEIMFCSKIISGSSCNKLFHTSIIYHNKICFPEQFIVNEDRVFCMNYYQYCLNTYYISEPLYQYCYNENSCTHMKYKCKKFDLRQVGFLDSMEHIEKLYQYESENIKAYMCYKKIRYCINLMFQMMACGDYKKEIADRITKNIRKDYRLCKSYKLLNGAIQIALFCVYMFPRLTYINGRLIYLFFGKHIKKHLD